MIRRRFLIAATAAMIAAPAGAALAQVGAPPPPLPPAAPPSASGASGAGAPPSAASIECGACGKVESIRQTTARQQWTPLGSGVGVGGVPDLGSAPAGVTSYKIGPGLSNQGLVVLGSAGGAAYKKTPNSYEQVRWEVTVKLDAGGVRIVTLSYEPFVREGDRVRVAGNNVELLE
jgi:hypothetical protein